MKLKNILFTILTITLMISPATVYAQNSQEGEESVSSNEANTTAVTEMEDIDGAAQEQIADSVANLIQQTSAQNNQEYISIDSAFATMKDNLVNGGAVSLTQAAAGVEGFRFDYSMEYDVSKMMLLGGIDLAQVNYDYDNIIATMQLATDLDLEKPQITAMELFDYTYEGVYEAVQLDDLSIDTMYEGLNVNDALNSVKIEFANSFAASIETGSFSTVKNILSIGDVFSLASGDLPSQSLKSMNYLTSLTAGQAAANLSLAHQTMNTQDIQDKINGISDFTDIVSGGSSYTMMNTEDGSIIYRDGLFVVGMENNEVERGEDANSVPASEITSTISPSLPLTVNGYSRVEYNGLPGLPEEDILNNNQSNINQTTMTASEVEDLLNSGAPYSQLVQGNGLVTSDGVLYSGRNPSQTVSTTINQSGE